MSEAARVEIEGDTRLRATMMVASAALDHLDAAHTATARLVSQRARGAAPKLTGRLAGSLIAAATGDTARVSSDVVYAGVQHYGWAARGIPAHPFLTSAADTSKTIWLHNYETEIVGIVNQVKGA